MFEDSASAASSIVLQIGGQLFGAVFLAGRVVAQFPFGLASQASQRITLRNGPRLGPDQGDLRPAQRELPCPGGEPDCHRRREPDRVLPVRHHSTSFINFGAFTACTLVNASVVVHYVRQRRAGRRLHPLFYVMVRMIGAIICAYLPPSWMATPITLGMSWLVLGVVVLALITRGFKASSRR